MRTKSLFFPAITIIMMLACFSSRLEFTAIAISEEAELWWARVPADLNNDGMTDIVLQNNNGYGGWLGWLENQNRHTWIRHIIAETGPTGMTFACGDMEAGDIDLDGDMDILAFEHPGEWDDGGAPTNIYWYSNPDWESVFIGTAPDFIKDVSLADMNGDGRPDLVAITYEENALLLYRQDAPGQWSVALDTTVVNLHEGMDTGDIDGDGDRDIAANGYWMENPGAGMTDPWTIRSIDNKWHNQDGDWSKNATKVFCRDIDNDECCEVFISHSERAGYPVAMYRSDDPRSGQWTEHIIKNDFPSAHTLQVYDFDLDGDYDVLSGLNMHRAQALGQVTFPVIIFLNDGNLNWTEFLVTDQGIYNGQCADLEGDGDIDIFRLPTHDTTYFEVLGNLLR